MPDLSIFTSNDFISKSGIFVDLFFILSGFVIYHTYKDKTFTKYLSFTFIKKRLKRLLPLHFYTLGVLVILEFIKQLSYTHFPFSQPPFSYNSWESFWPQLLLLNSTPFFVDFSWNGPNWSISAELIAYLVFVVTSILSMRKNTYSFLIALLLVLFGYLFFYLNYGTYDITIDFNFSFIRGLIGFNLGVFVYHIAQKFRTLFNTFSNSICTFIEFMCIGIVLVTVSAINPYVKSNFYLLHIAFALLILVFSFERGAISKLLMHDVFQDIGRWSYSIYLNHFFLIAIYQMLAIKLLNLQGLMIFVAEVLLMGILLIYSKITYTQIEQRFYNRKDRN